MRSQVGATLGLTLLASCGTCGGGNQPPEQAPQQPAVPVAGEPAATAEAEPPIQPETPEQGSSPLLAVSSSRAAPSGLVGADGKLQLFADVGPQWSSVAMPAVAGPPTALGGIKTVTAGMAHHCVVSGAERDVVCWGEGNGALGDGRVDPPGAREPRLVHVPGLTGVVQVGSYDATTCALDAAGKVRCWGESWNGQLGLGDDVHAACPTWVEGARSGRYFTRDACPTPTIVPGLPEVRQIAVGRGHVCALTSDGDVWCWGEGDYGRVGAPAEALERCGSNRCLPSPRKVEGVAEVASIDAGSATCAIGGDGGLTCWGSRGEQLVAATRIPRVSAARHVCTTATMACVVSGDEPAPRCWDADTLFDGPPSEPSALIGGLTGTVEELRCGWTSACARTAEGGVFCWNGPSDSALAVTFDG